MNLFMNSRARPLRVTTLVLSALSCLVLLPLWCVVLVMLLALEVLFLFRAKTRDAVRGGARPDTGKTTLIVLNWNGRPLLEKNLPSICAAASHDGGAHEVLLVDNGSQDDSVEWVRGNVPGVKILDLGRNLQFARANNVAAERATTDIVVFLNNDVRVEQDFIRPLLDGFREPDTFAVACRTHLVTASGPETDVSRTVALWQHGRWSPSHEPLTSTQAEQPLLPIAWACGGMCAMDRRKFLDLGGFDPLFSPFYYEDFDLSYQAWKRGWRVLLTPASRVHHDHQGSIGRLPTRYVSTVIQRNAILIIWKGISDLKMLAQHLVWCPAIVLRAVEQLGFGHAAWAFAGAVIRLPVVLQRRWSTSTWRARTDSEVQRIMAGGPAAPCAGDRP